MAVVQGNQILASEFNTLRGEVNRWFADNYPSVTFGDGNQTYGWGGSAAGSVSAGNEILASEMNALIDRCNIGEDVVNGVSGAISQVVTGNLIQASEFNAVETKSDAITTNRLDIEAAEMSLAGTNSSVRSTNWAAAINCTFRRTFTSNRL